MFFKLLKHNLQFIYKQTIIFIIIVLFCAIISRLTAFDNPPFIILIINKFASGAALGFSVGLIINAIMRTWGRFITNTYGDESYLTHTLPVSKHTIWAAIFTAGVVTIFTSILTFIAAILIMYYSPETINALKQLFYDTFGQSVNLIAFITVSIIGIFSQLLFTLQAGFCGIILGHHAHSHRILRSVLYGVGIYLLGALILYVLAIIWSYLNEDINQLLFHNTTTEISAVFHLLLGIAPSYITYIVILYFVSAKILTRGVDIE